MTGLVGLPPERTGRAALPQLTAIREAVAGAVASGTWRTEPPAREDHWRDVRILRHFPADGPARATLLHFHGGGFRMGCPESIGPYAAALARRCRVEVICPAYRLAPEHPFPAGLADGVRVLDQLRQAGDGSIILSGESAGGGLAASLAALCGANGVAVHGLVLHSPWLDLTVSAASYAANAARDLLFSKDAAKEAAWLYLQDGCDPRGPLISPLFAQADHFPRTLLTVGTGEVLADDSRKFYAMLQAARVPARLLEIEGMDHVAVTRSLDLPGAREAFDATCDFIGRVAACRG